MHGKIDFYFYSGSNSSFKCDNFQHSTQDYIYINLLKPCHEDITSSIELMVSWIQKLKKIRIIKVSYTYVWNWFINVCCSNLFLH
jgi:hypothetical protein